MKNPLVASMIFDTPLLAHPGKAAAVAEVVLGTGGAVMADLSFRAPPRAGIEGDVMGAALDAAGVTPMAVIDGVAVISIDGSLTHRGAWIGAQSGLVSYQGIQAQLARARGPGIRAVALDMASYGGVVPGAFETARRIAALAAEKPVWAICNAAACSAGYMLASQATRIIAPEDAMVGSIGCVQMHVDRSEQMAREGVKVTFVHAGAKKVEGNGLEPLPDDLRARMQSGVDRVRTRFAELVAAGRPRVSVAAALATEADVYDGPEALALGLIDAVAEPSDAFAALRAAVNRG